MNNDININVDVNNDDRIYIDPANNIAARNNDIKSINVNTNNTQKVLSIGKIIGKLIGLPNGELNIFVYVNYYNCLFNEKGYTRNFCIKELVRDTKYSSRTINRHIDSLISKKIIIYNIDTDIIKINPRYELVNNIDGAKNLKVISIVFTN